MSDTCGTLVGRAQCESLNVAAPQIDAVMGYGIDMGKILWARYRMRMTEMEATEGRTRQELVAEALRLGPAIEPHACGSM